MARSEALIGGGRGGGADPNDVAGGVRPLPTLVLVGAIGGGCADRMTATFVVAGGGVTCASLVGRSICSTMR